MIATPPAPVTTAQQGPAVEPSVWSDLLAFGKQPGVVETLLAVALLATLFFVWWRLTRLVTGARSRQALMDYLLGVEQAMHGDLRGARKRLQAVIQTDPENHYARLLLGKVLAELGEPEQAHTQHLYLQRAFGIESPANELLLAQSLLGAGMAMEAAQAAERVLQRTPGHVAGWDFVYRARLQSGDFESAAVAGKRLLELVREGPRRAQLQAELARTFAQSGVVRLQRGDQAGATAALEQAVRLDQGAAHVPLLAARLAAAQYGIEPTVQSLLTGSEAGGAPTGNALVAKGPRTTHLPAPLGPSAVDRSTTGLPMATLAGLVGPGRWACRACGAALPGAMTECPRCQSQTPARLLEPLLVAEVVSATHTMDAIEVNDAHVQRLVRALLDGEGGERTAARTTLLDLRERAVEELLGQAWHRTGDAQEAAIDVLRAMGPAIAPSLFAASDALEQQRLLPLGTRSPAALVGRIVQGFDRSALPHVGPLFASARPEHRKILIDFFLGLADLGEFQIVLERFPPLEILHRFNKADAEVLRRFLQAVPPGHFVADSLLLEPTFYREEVVLAAIPAALHPEVLTRTLLRRGPSRSLVAVLIAALGEPALAEVAQGLLTRLGAAVLDHVLGAYTDVERPADERRRLAAVLQQLGAAAVEGLCSSFGPEPTDLDEELRGILAAIGDAAVPALGNAYGASGWLEKVSIGLISRHTNRRVQIVGALRGIGSPAAMATLRALAAAERDGNLRLRLQQALHDHDGAADAGAGESEGDAHGPR